MIRNIIDNWKLRKNVYEMDKSLKTGTGVLPYFREPSESLRKFVRLRTGTPVSSDDWEEAWYYLICRTRVQCIMRGVTLDFDEICKGATLMFAIMGKVSQLRNRWEVYSQTEAPIGVSIDTVPREKVIAWTRLYVHFVFEQLSKEKALNLVAVENNISDNIYLAIALKGEKLAVQICKKLEKAK